MAGNGSSSSALTLGHVAFYARDGRWRRALAKSLDASGHSHQEAARPEEIHRLLASQRFDVLALKVRDDEDAREIAAALDGAALPPHGIVVGSASAPLLALHAEREGTMRYVPGPLPAREVSHLVDVSMNAGGWEDGASGHATAAEIEEVDLEETIESAAAAVYAQARRKRQRFSTVVEGPVVPLLADAGGLKRAVIALLKLGVTAAPRGALVSVEARTGTDECLIRVHAADGRRRAAGSAQLADALNEEARTLTTVSRDIQRQGGLLWVELLGPQALALCISLPLPTGEDQSVSA